ncbi:MAG: ATP-binding protein [bacterium]|nr:ATP-binding protein [bacterium]
MTKYKARTSYLIVLQELNSRLAERAPTRIQLLAGPRQVGKTTLLLELARGLGPRAFYQSGDGPEAAAPGAWERLWQQVERLAREHAEQGGVVVMLDEVQHISDWPLRLKGEWDRILRLGLPVHVIASGSSALHLGTGSRESLAGRFERLTLSHWGAEALAAAFGLPRREAIELVVNGGACPGAVTLRHDHARRMAYLRDAIVEPAIGRDILSLAAVRKPALLRQVFAAAASSPAQVVSLQKLQGMLADRGALETIAHYLKLLEEAFLVAGLERHSERLLRRRASPPKLVLLNNAFLAAMDPRGAPDREREPDRFGAWVENACLAFAWNAGQQVRCWREEPLEVNAVLEGSWGPLAIEVKTGPFVAADLRGLFEFTRRHPAYRPLLLCDERHLEVARRCGVEAMAWDAFLWHGPHAVD